MQPKIRMYFTISMIRIAHCIAVFTLLALSGCTGYEDQTTRNLIADEPKLEVAISAMDSVIAQGQDVVLNIKLTNAQNEAQQMLWEVPQYWPVPWGTSGEVVDLETGASIFEVQSKSMLVSQLYSDQQLAAHYKDLKQGQSLKARVSLSNIVVYDSYIRTLPPGRYSIQIFYYINFSNKIEVVVE